MLVVVGLGGSTVRAGDKEDIVARWDNAVTDNAYIRFNDDGTFKEVTILGTTEGKYCLLSKEAIELDVPGLLYGRNVTEFKYKMSGDTLELKLLGQWVKYKRVK